MKRYELQTDQLRLLVTGSRGKSSVVRLLHTALNAVGVRTYSKITGTVPRELGPKHESRILRSSGAHVEEMRWWLKSLPEAEGIILENGAISPDLQSLAARWLCPNITILTNFFPDHQECWGATAACAAKALTAGIPTGGLVVIPASIAEDPLLLELLVRRECRVHVAAPLLGDRDDWRLENMMMALEVVKLLGMDEKKAISTMQDIAPDRYDFRVFSCLGAEVALAFSANDLNSTKRLFRSLVWKEEETLLIYNHRFDRKGRLKSFVQWLDGAPWREVVVIGDRPHLRVFSTHYRGIRDKADLLNMFRPGGRVFGCGNLSGLPLSLSTTLYR